MGENKIKKLFENTKLLVALIALLVIVIAAVVVCCVIAGNSGDSGEWKSEKYVYQNTIPCTDQPDAWMTIDGNITEAEWQDNKWMTYKTKGITYSVTTEFTETGIYIAGKAEDPFVYHYGDYAFANNTCFEIYLVREDEKEVNTGASQFVRPGRFVRLHIDPMHTVSYNNTPCYTAAKVDGELNTAKDSVQHTTNGWSFETYISWEAMRLEEKYFAEDGIPDTIKMYVKYMMIDGENDNKINIPLEPINTESFRYDTYWHFGRQGLKGDYSSALLNNAPDGPAATDQLTYSLNDKGDLVVTSDVSRTQITWAQGPRSETFMIEATFTPSQAIEGRTGLGFILYDLPNRTGGYNIFSLNVGELMNSRLLRLSSSPSTDGLQWLTDYSFNDIAKTNYTSPYGKNSVHLKLIKIGGYMYYFVDNEFYKAEFIDSLKGAVNVGLFFNAPGSATNYRYEDYTGREDEARELVKDDVYYVNVPGVTTYGTVTSNGAIISQGQSATIQIYPASGYILGDIFNNGQSFLNAVQGTMYTFVPTADVNIEAKFHRLDTKNEVCKVTLRIQDQEGAALVGVTYRISDDEGKIVYSGKDNGRGVIMLSVPKKCTIQTDTQTHHFSGNYTVVIEKDGYIARTVRVETGEESKYETNVSLEKFKYGNVVVNGKNSTDVQGVLKLLVEQNLYYSGTKTVSGREVAYNRDYIANEYFATIKITSERATGVPNVPGISLTKGAGETITLKVSPWGPNQLFIQCGITNGRDAAVSVSGFNHSHSEKGGSAMFSVARIGDNVFIFDGDGDLAVVLNNLGIHTVGDHQFVEQALLEGTNTNIANFFLVQGQDHALGLYNDYNNGSANTYFDVSWIADDASIKNAASKITFIPLNPKFDSTVESVTYAGAYDPNRGFVAGAMGTIYIRTNSETKAVHNITLHYADGTKETVYAKYNSLTRNSEIQLNLRKRVVNVTYAYGEVLNVTGSITAANDIVVNGTTITFIDKNSGTENSVVCGYDGSYSVDLFKSTYDVFAENVGGVASLENQRIDSAAVINLTLKKEDLYIGHGTANGAVINSSSNVGVGTMADSLDGKVTIAANNSSMMAVLGNQVYTGKDSFEYTIRVNGSHMPVTPGTHPGDAQIGFGFSDGTNWWVFFVKYGEQAGKSIGVGVWNSGMGGGDFVYSNALSPNKMSVNDADRTLNAEIVLTIVKNGNELVLYAGEGAGRVKLLTASTDGYQYADPNGTITSEVAEKTQVSKLGGFFDQNKEFILCLGSFYYNADVTFEVEVK